MRLSSHPARLVPALFLACALSACGGGGSNGGSGFFGGLPGTGTTPTTPAAPTPTDNSAPVMKSCAP